MHELQMLQKVVGNEMCEVTVRVAKETLSPRDAALNAKCMHGGGGGGCTHDINNQRSLQVTNPIGCSNLDYQMNGILHEKSPVSSHHQSAPLSLRGLDGRNNALDEILGIMRVLLEHSHPLPQAAGSWLLVAVRVGLDNTDLHHFAPQVCCVIRVPIGM